MFVLSVLEAPNTKTNSLCVQTSKLFLILISTRFGIHLLTSIVWKNIMEVNGYQPLIGLVTNIPEIKLVNLIFNQIQITKCKYPRRHIDPSNISSNAEAVDFTILVLLVQFSNSVFQISSTLVQSTASNVPLETKILELHRIGQTSNFPVNLSNTNKISTADT